MATTSTTDPSSDEPRNTWVLTSGIDSDAVATARQWLEDAAGQAIVLKQDLLAAVRTSGSRLLAALSSRFHETKEAVEWIKMEYAAREDELVSKIKEGVAIAAAHPNLSAGVAVSLRLVAFKVFFCSLKLKLVNMAMDEPLPTEPVGVEYGVLENGLSYCSNPKPRMRAALALVVKVGSVLEDEEERGVAHIVEYLAFNATTKYTNHDIVKFLESIGAEFGACQNALTSSDETIYELLVPVDKPGLLSQAISVLAEFSSEIRVAAEDLEKERGAVLEEYAGCSLDSNV